MTEPATKIYEPDSEESGSEVKIGNHLSQLEIDEIYRSDRISYELASKIYEYREDGTIWKKICTRHGRSQSSCDDTSRECYSKPVGGNKAYSNEALRTRIGNQTYQVHRLTWLLNKGEWPSGSLSHKDKNKANNRIDNLDLRRIGTRFQSFHANKTRSVSGMSSHYGYHLTADSLDYDNYKESSEDRWSIVERGYFHYYINLGIDDKTVRLLPSCYFEYNDWKSARYAAYFASRILHGDPIRSKIDISNSNRLEVESKVRDAILGPWYLLKSIALKPITIRGGS